MSDQRSRADLKLAWTAIETIVDDIYKKGLIKINKERYVEAYSIVFNYCSSLSINCSNVPLNSEVSCGSTQSFIPNFIGGELYERLRIFLLLHTEELMKKYKGLSNEKLLELYLRDFEEYKVASKSLNGMCNYLNRHWIKRERDQGRTHIYEIYDLAVNTWRDCLLGTHYKHIKETAIRIGEKENMDEKDKTSLMSRVMKTFSEIKVNENEWSFNIEM